VEAKVRVDRIGADLGAAVGETLGRAANGAGDGGAPGAVLEAAGPDSRVNALKLNPTLLNYPPP